MSRASLQRTVSSPKLADESARTIKFSGPSGVSTCHVPEISGSGRCAQRGVDPPSSPKNPNASSRRLIPPNYPRPPRRATQRCHNAAPRGTPRGANVLSDAGYRWLVHPTHSATRHRGCCRLVLLLLDHDTLCGEHQGSNRGRVLQCRTSDLGRVYNPRNHHVLVLI